MRHRFLAAAAVLAALLSGCGSASGVQATQTALTAQTAPAATAIHEFAATHIAASAAAAIQVPNQVEPSDIPAALYCQQTGGLVEIRRAVYGTNGPTPLPLASFRAFCQYTAKDTSRIHILLSSLYATQPTLAVLAYIGAPKMGTCQGNPASCYCTLLGGSDQFGGTTAAGGGWYKKNSIDQVLEACVFPDMSSIDSWGLAYHSAGIIRGIDLEKVVRFKLPG
ncbi:MAG TPA: hypothetical protein VKT72_00700 [Candidatus Baltobacteraceae bacterium]|nr:hypothetical protein [Candidatus Baltobacteraceae bacterium]